MKSALAALILAGCSTPQYHERTDPIPFPPAEAARYAPLIKALDELYAVEMNKRIGQYQRHRLRESRTNYPPFRFER